MKKIISIMLVFILIFSAISVSVTAADLCTNGKEHEWSEFTVVPASCTEKEYQKKECARCHQVYKKYTSGSEALGHLEDIRNNADGTHTTYCKRANCKFSETKDCSMAKPVCGQILVCDICNVAYSSKIYHNYKTVTIIQKATCLKDGKESVKCVDCGATEERAITAPGHEYTKVTVAPTCREQGYDLFECKNCDESHKSNYNAVLAHDYIETVVEATCTKDGLITYKCKTCSLPKESTVIPKLGHDMSGFVVTKAPTCTEGGMQTDKCSRCSLTTTMTLEPFGHSWSATKQIVLNSTCTAKGSKAIVCTREGCNIIKEGTIEEIAMKPHDYKAKAVTKEATCETAGEKAKVCKNCTAKTDIEVIKALGHDWDKGTVKVAADCQKSGTTTFKCQRKGCGKTEDRVTDKLDCKYVEKIKEPTCTEEGYSTFTCSMCKSSYIDKKVEKLNHDIDSWYEKAPTCTEDGITRYGCLDCDYTYTEPAAALGHTYPDNWSIILEPDCQSKGASIKVCLRCNDVISQTLPKTGHIDLDGDSKCDTCDKTIAVVEPEKPSEPEKEPETKPCDCNCHAGGIKAFFFNLVNFFAKIFDKNARVCACGKAH